MNDKPITVKLSHSRTFMYIPVRSSIHNTSYIQEEPQEGVTHTFKRELMHTTVLYGCDFWMPKLTPHYVFDHL